MGLLQSTGLQSLLCIDYFSNVFLQRILFYYLRHVQEFYQLQFGIASDIYQTFLFILIPCLKTYLKYVNGNTSCLSSLFLIWSSLKSIFLFEYLYNSLRYDFISICIKTLYEVDANIFWLNIYLFEFLNICLPIQQRKCCPKIFLLFGIYHLYGPQNSPHPLPSNRKKYANACLFSIYHVLNSITCRVGDEVKQFFAGDAYDSMVTPTSLDLG